jgi:hypothetical protein
MASPNAYVNESFGISSPSSPYQQPYGNMVDFLPGPATLHAVTMTLAFEENNILHFLWQSWLIFGGRSFQILSVIDE